MSQKDKILNLLQDNRWHSFRELLAVYYKYTQRIFDLRKIGHVIEERRSDSNPHACDYRLIGMFSKLPVESPAPVNAGSARSRSANRAQGVDLFKTDQHGNIY